MRHNRVNQPSMNPTNKLTAATVAAAGVSVVGLILRNTFPDWYDPEVMLHLTPIVAFATGWFITDNPNVSIESHETDGEDKGAEV